MEQVSELRPVLPEQCGPCGCGLPLQVEEWQTVGELRRHQVTELPPMKAHIIELTARQDSRQNGRGAVRLRRPDLKTMYRTYFDPWAEGWRLFSSFMGCGAWTGRRFYTRKERIEELEKLKKKLQDEIAGIDEMIQDLKRREAERS